MFKKLAIVVLFVSIETAYLPTYFSRCDLHDPKLNECITRAANKVIPRIANGDPYYDIPYMKPLFIPGPLTLKNPDLQFSLNNIYVFGIEKTKVARMNFTHTYVSFTVQNPAVTILADYKINGNILNTYVFGSGFINITLVNGLYEYEQAMPYVHRDGDVYFQNIDSRLIDYRTEKSIYYFDNLYHGDRYLGTYMNDYLNKNWRAVQRILKPLAKPAIAKVFFDASSGIANNVPVNDIYRPIK